MKILVARTFGIGNMCIAIPMLKALIAAGHSVDVLIGSTADDFGARTVLEASNVFVNQIHVDYLHHHGKNYDVAILSIPYDGRWGYNPSKFHASRVIDGRARPNNDPSLGFNCWEKHESSYQLDLLKEEGLISTQHLTNHFFEGWRNDHVSNDDVYVGVGFKRDPSGFGKSKHFGNDRFSSLLKEIYRLRPSVRFHSTGNKTDIIESCSMIVAPSYAYRQCSLEESFKKINECSSYIGNDTGMMHVAAALKKRVFGLFAYSGLLKKNPPLTLGAYAIEFSEWSDVEIAEAFVNYNWGSK